MIDELQYMVVDYKAEHCSVAGRPGRPAHNSQEARKEPTKGRKQGGKRPVWLRRGRFEKYAHHENTQADGIDGYGVRRGSF